MTPDQERRKNLAEFLQKRRKRLRPEEVGLTPGNRRRTPGLRREEVAQLANIGVSWYTSLEQGRDVNPSIDVLENLAKALQLTSAERQHLFLLAQQPLLCSLTSKEQVSPSLSTWIQTLNHQPAYIIDRRWDLLTWNKYAEQIFNFSKEIPPHSHNYIWRFFHHKSLHNSPNWREAAKQLVAQFRSDSARFPGDPAFTELINDLLNSVEEFYRWWNQYDVQGAFEGAKTLHHPTLGKLAFDQITFQLATNADIRVVILTPIQT